MQCNPGFGTTKNRTIRQYHKKKACALCAQRHTKSVLSEMWTYAIHVRDDRRNTREASTASGHDTHVLVRVLTTLALPVVHVVQVRNGFTEGCMRVSVWSRMKRIARRVAMRKEIVTGPEGIDDATRSTVMTSMRSFRTRIIKSKPLKVPKIR